MYEQPQKKNISSNQVFTALLNEEEIFPPVYLRFFSDIEKADLEALRSIWPQVKVDRRVSLMEDMEEISDADTLVSFENVARMALEDTDPRVRATAIRILWEFDDPRMSQTFRKMLREDSEGIVRAAAASALGRYIYLGEIEEIAQDLLHEIEEDLLRAHAGQDEELVRRRALEALGFSGRQEVQELIRRAYDTDDNDWLITALFAMGRSADQTWEPDVRRMLRHPVSEVQFEAVRAAGELGIASARQPLLDMLEEGINDEDVYNAAIWSLSQIGGEDVRETLEALAEESEDDEEMELLENALDNLEFTESFELFDMLDIGEDGEMREVSPDELVGYGDDDDLSLEDDAEEGNSDPSAPPPAKPDKNRPRHKRKS